MMSHSSRFVAIVGLAVAVFGVAGLHVERNLHKKSLPHNGRVAILFRGQTFRKWEAGKRFQSGGVPACSRDMVELQKNASRTVTDLIIEPLEKRGNKVEVFITDTPCKMTNKLVDVLGAERVVKTVTVQTQGQAENMNAALHVLKEAAGGKHGRHNVAHNYNLVIIIRHDMAWKMS